MLCPKSVTWLQPSENSWESFKKKERSNFPGFRFQILSAFPQRCNRGEHMWMILHGCVTSSHTPCLTVPTRYLWSNVLGIRVFHDRFQARIAPHSFENSEAKDRDKNTLFLDQRSKQWPIQHQKSRWKFCFPLCHYFDQKKHSDTVRSQRGTSQLSSSPWPMAWMDVYMICGDMRTSIVYHHMPDYRPVSVCVRVTLHNCITIYLSISLSSIVNVVSWSGNKWALVALGYVFRQGWKLKESMYII